MKKTTLLWVDKNNSNPATHRPQLQELKKLEPLYGITVQLETDSQDKLNPRVDYIIICSSEIYPKQAANLHKMYNVLGIIVYCHKQLSSKAFTEDTLVILATNSFEEVMKKILLVINEPFFGCHEVAKIEEDEGCRFVVNAEKGHTTPEFFESEEYQRRKKHILEFFRLDFDVEKDLEKTKKRLGLELQKYFQSKQLLLMEKELSRIETANSMKELVKTCIYFYSLQKSRLYSSLNLILKNLRMTKFQLEFERLRLFAFLLMLNCFFFYSEIEYVSEVYRYTDFDPPLEMQNHTITVCNFYSTSKKDSLELFRAKKTRIVIETFDHTRREQSLCFFNYFEACKHSAYKAEDEVIFAPFTRFQVTKITKGKQTQVHLKELPDNDFLPKICDINLLQNNQQQTSKFAREVNYHTKYQKMLKAKNPESEELVKVYVNFGALYASNLEYKWALHTFKKALEIASRVPKHPKLTQIYNNIGMIESKFSHNAEALQWFQKALETCDTTAKRTLISIFNNKASTLQQLDRFPQSHKQYQEALKLCKEIYPAKHLMVATILNNIGYVQQKASEFAESIPTFQKSLSIYQYIQGQQSAKSALCYENIAHSYLSLNNLQEARSNLVKAAALELASRGQYSPNLIGLYCTLGGIDNKKQDYEEAKKWYCLALKVSQRVNGHNHEQTAVLHSNIGSIDIGLGLPEQGILNLEKSLEILYMIYKDKNHGLIDTISDNLQDLKAKMEEGFFD